MRLRPTDPFSDFRHLLVDTAGEALNGTRFVAVTGVTDKGVSMRRSIRSAPWTLLMLVLPTLLAAQQPQQMQMQMQRMQEQVVRMQESMQQMQRLQMRAQDIEQQMLQQMERLRQQQMLDEQARHRLREQERVRDMAHAMSTAAREMVQAMERARDMLGDPGTAWGPEMEQDMIRLREHMEEMAGSMDEGLAILQRLRDRLSQG